VRGHQSYPLSPRLGAGFPLRCVDEHLFSWSRRYSSLVRKESGQLLPVLARDMASSPFPRTPDYFFSIQQQVVALARFSSDIPTCYLGAVFSPTVLQTQERPPGQDSFRGREGQITSFEHPGVGGGPPTRGASWWIPLPAAARSRSSFRRVEGLQRADLRESLIFCQNLRPSESQSFLSSEHEVVDEVFFFPPARRRTSC